jgi:nucleotide sugar dehydrogenase
VTAACFAWLGHTVQGVETDPARADALSAGRVPFYEPGLPDLLREVMSIGRLRFGADPRDTLRSADAVFLCVGTPSGPDGRPDVSQLEHAADVLTRHVRPDTVVVAKSTVPVGSGRWLEDRLDASLPAAFRGRVHVVSNPEFLREGSAIEDFLVPDRVVLGGEATPVQRIVQLYRPILDQSYPGADPARLPALHLMDVTSAEMVKYAANAALATKVSFANEMSELCELAGADARLVLPAVGTDRRIGGGFLNPGLGWGGSCLPKDVAALIELGRTLGHDAALLSGVRGVNERRTSWAVSRLEAEVGRLAGRAITVFGLAFKGATDDLRDSPAVALALDLLGRGAVVRAFDPVVRELPPRASAVELADDPYDAATGADAVVIATDWPEFVAIDLGTLRERMSGDVILDGRGVLADRSAGRGGLRVIGAGWDERPVRADDRGRAA